MAAVGYSGTSLLKKLGIKPEMKVLTINAPADYFDLLQADISKQFVSSKQIPDLIHLFAKDLIAFNVGMKLVLKTCKQNSSAVAWISWYKKSSGIATDITEDTIRAFAVKNGAV